MDDKVTNYQEAAKEENVEKKLDKLEDELDKIENKQESRADLKNLGTVQQDVSTSEIKTDIPRKIEAEDKKEEDSQERKEDRLVESDGSDAPLKLGKSLTVFGIGIALLVFAILATAAYLFGDLFERNQEELSTPQPTPVELPVKEKEEEKAVSPTKKPGNYSERLSIITAGWETYRNSDNGLIFKHPKELNVREALAEGKTTCIKVETETVNMAIKFPDTKEEGCLLQDLKKGESAPINQELLVEGQAVSFRGEAIVYFANKYEEMVQEYLSVRDFPREGYIIEYNGDYKSQLPTQYLKDKETVENIIASIDTSEMDVIDSLRKDSPDKEEDAKSGFDPIL